MKQFWITTDSDETKIKLSEFRKFLRQQGFGFVIHNGQREAVRLRHNILSKTNASDIRHFVSSYLDALLNEGYTQDQVDSIQECFLHLINKMPSNAFLDTLTVLDINLIRDTRDKAFVFYKECYVEINKVSISLNKYEDLPGVIWGSQIIEREFEKVNTEMSSNSIIARFFFNCMNQETERYYSLITILGYLQHRYKTREYSKAIVFCDETISDNPDGGTGKSLTVNALNKMVNVAVEDGKNTSFNDRPFQQVTDKVDILVFEDLDRKFPFEKLFPFITDDATVDQKYVPRHMVKFEDSPKVLLNTNYVIIGQGNSFDRRKVEIEFSQHYNRSNTPLMEFGEALFDSWNDQEYLLFDNFMLLCIQEYLKNGIIEPFTINLETRKLHEETCKEFVDFISEIEIGIELNKKLTMNRFINRYSKDHGDLKQRTFNKWLEIYAKYKGLEFKDRKSNSDYLFTYRNST